MATICTECKKCIKRNDGLWTGVHKGMLYYLHDDCRDKWFAKVDKKDELPIL